MQFQKALYWKSDQSHQPTVQHYDFSEECSNKGGTNEGTCASGFGVCCSCKWIYFMSIIISLIQNVFIKVSLGCGSSNSNNNSYIIQSASTSISNPCKIKICPCTTSICRIRYDLVVSKVLVKKALSIFTVPTLKSLNEIGLAN